MGSQQALADEALVPQQDARSPAATRFAASPYFSFTTSRMFSVLIGITPLFARQLFRSVARRRRFLLHEAGQEPANGKEMSRSKLPKAARGRTGARRWGECLRTCR